MAYHRLLIGPTPAELVTALREATREANRDRPILDLDFDAWEDFVANAASRREGRRDWSDTARGDTARVGVTWWTDHVGRRHVRVAAAGPHDGPQRHHPTRNDPRPPLWHLYPDRVFYRERAGLGEWWGVCGCGVAGRPESVGWMGSMCGPCHDRAQEGQAADEAFPTAALLHQGGPLAPAFSTVGARLAVVLTEAPDVVLVCVHDLDAGTHADLRRSAPLISDPAFSPDGLLAFATEYNALIVHDLITGEWQRRQTPGFPTTRIAFSPDAKHVAVGGPEGFQIWDRSGGLDDWRPVEDAPGAVNALAFSPGGELLAVGLERGLFLAHPAGGAPLREVADAVPPTHVVCDLAFRPGGRELCCLTVPARDPSYLRGLMAGWRPDEATATVQRFGLGPDGDRRLSRRELRNLLTRQLSPCGRHLVGHPGDDNVACVIDTGSGEELGRVGWDTAERISHAVFSPDGRTLALVDATGTLKLVPWSALLG